MKVSILSGIALLIAQFAMPSVQTLDAATPEDFGFGTLKANGHPLVGSIPLLMVVYELSNPGTETGSFDEPFDTLAKGVDAVSRGGTLKFKQSGTSAETLSILKPLDLQALGGPVTIGR
jgi:hypothetical protein